MTKPEGYEYAGNMHVHSVHSDGSGTIPAIAGAAGGAGLDFVCINDHNTLVGAALGEAGYYGEVLAIIGLESNWTRNHYLAYGVERVPEPNDAHPQRVIDDVRAQGGTGFIAHPYENGSRYVLGGRTYCWTEWDVHGFDGIEVWNMLSQWRDAMTTVPRALWYGLIAPGTAFRGPEPRAMGRFDSLCTKGHVSLVAGSDCHAIRLGAGRARFTFGGYGYSFGCVNMHVILDEPLAGRAIAREDKARLRSGTEHEGRESLESVADPDLYLRDTRAIIKALGKGSSFAALHLLGDPRGFRFRAEGDAGTVGMGGTYGCRNGRLPTLWYKMPEHPGKCRVRLIRNGGMVGEVNAGRGGRFNIDTPGVYRVEVLKVRGPALRTWILGNPVWVV